MANKRMFCMSIVDSDAFLEMPLSTQCLYFHLNMRADDDGFIGNPKRIMRVIGASEDDLKLLIAKRFILVFDDGVIVIKHWRMHNTIQKDRYTPTVYQDELNTLFIKSNKSYSLENSLETKCIQNVSKKETECKQVGNDNVNDLETFCKHSGNIAETKCIQNVSTDIDIELDKDLNTHTEENSEKQTETQNQENLCVSESVCASKSFADDSDFESQGISDQQKYYARLVFDVWDKADLPRPKTGYITFLMSDFRLALGELQKQKLHSDDVIKACENYASVVELGRQGKSWWKSQSTFDRFVQPNIIRRFLPDYFKPEEYRQDKGGGGSAISRSAEYENVEINF